MRIILTLLTIFFLSNQLSFAQSCPNIVWADEFSGSTLDLSKWSYQTGDGCGTSSTCGWGNNELQIYETANVNVNNGLLQITADREQIRGRRYRYTSGRIRTINTGDWTYGRFEASIKLPQGGGLWPAFWMLSTNEPYGGWPQSGEIDIMEFVGNDPIKTLGVIHYGDPYPDNQQQGTSFPFYDPNYLNDFHEYAVEWSPSEIKWYVDGYLFQTKTSADVAPYNWPFDQDMHFLLNVAVGGNLGGEVDDSIFPATMEVEYVRVYDGNKPSISGERFVEYQGQNTYTINNIAISTTVNWTVPSGATIVSGQGTPTITMNWGTSPGPITAEFNSPCGSEILTVNTSMAPQYVKDFVFENYDETGNASYSSSDGVLTEVANPNPNSINSSSLSGEYVRNSSAQYDNIVFSTSSISNAAEYVFGDKRFYMDVLTSAPIGTEIIIQLETPLATSGNFPDGRHSRYFGYTRATDEWHRIYFDFFDRPDFGAAPDTDVSNLLVLFNSNTFTGDTYYFDNLDSYIQGSGGPTNSPPTVTITSPTDGSTFDQGTLLTISADASDSDGSITQVEFFVDGNSIGTDSSSPYAVDWTVAVGNSEITAVATDNESASTTSSIVNITGQSTGSASFMYVESIVTGTAGAGQGNKYGTATVTLSDELGNPVGSATVDGTFSGTFNESVSGSTNTSGSVTLQTSSTAKGSVTVNFCVDNISHPTLTYDSSLNALTCTNPNAKLVPGGELSIVITEFSLLNNYPNPFNPSTQISYQIPQSAHVTLDVFNMAGQRVANLVDAQQSQGEYTVTFNAHGLSSGIYIYRLVAGNFVQNRQMVLIK